MNAGPALPPARRRRPDRAQHPEQRRGRVVSLALSFVLTPFILDALGETAFGVWVLAQVVVGYGALLDLGIGAALVRHVADLRAREESDEAALVAGTSTRTYAVLATVALVLGGGLAVLAPDVLGTGSLAPATVTWVFVLVTLGFAVNLAGTPAIASLRGLQRYDLSNAVTVAGALANAALTVLVLVLDGGVVALVAVSVPVALGTQARRRRHAAGGRTPATPFAGRRRPGPWPGR